MPNLSGFQHDLECLVNRYGLENASDTPDFILAQYLRRCLETFNEAMQERERWYGRPIERPPVIDETPIGLRT
jgi:hypothetical protein